MPNYSAKEMLLRMAEGGEATYGKYGQTAADLLAAEQRILGEIADDPSSWDVETAYNAILESGVSVDDALAAGVKQSTIDAIFTSPEPRFTPTYITPSSVESSFTAYSPYANMTQEEIAANAKQYVAGLAADGVIDEAEKREVQRIATERGVTFQDMLAAGVSPELLFTSPDFVEEEKKVIDVFPQTQTEYVPPTVYQPIDFDPGIYAPGEEALDREFRDSAPRTEVTEDVMGTQQLTGFDYTPAAKLLSATGSGFSFTPPSVTSRPRSLMNTNTLNRYTQGRSAQDLRQLTGGDQARYDQYSSLLNRTGSYGGGLSRSQLYALMRQQDSQNRTAPVSGAAPTGTIADYLRLNEDVGIDYARAKAAGEIPANTTPESFALNHYNTYGRAEIAAGTRTPFTLAQAQGGGQSYTSPAIGQFGEGDEESRQSNFTTQGYNTELLARDLGTAGGARIVPVFAEGGPVKKSEGFADNGPADSMTADELTAQLMAMDTEESPAPAQEPRPTDQVQTESQAMLDRLLTTATRTPFTPEGERSIFGNAIAGIPDVVGGLYDYGKEVVTSPSPSAKMLTDIYGMGKAVKQSAKEDPAGFALDNFPVSQQVRAVNRAEDASGLANAARARGDFEEADRLEAAVTVEMISAFPFMKAKAPKVSRKGIITVADDLPAGDVVQTDSRKLLDNLTATTAIETPALEAPTPTGTATVPVPPAEIIPDAKGHSLPPILLTQGTGEKPIMPVVQSFTPQNKNKVLGEIDAVVRTNPNALASANNWLTAEAQAFGGDYLPAPPSQAIGYNQTPSALAAKLDKLTPQLKATVDEGFRYVNEIKNLYNSKIATPDLTGRMFLWGILSRGAGPVQQEAAFLDLVSKAEPYIAKSVNGEFTDADLTSWKQMVSESLPEGSPAKQVTMNANAAGTLLKALSEKSDNGQSALRTLHNDLADPKVSGPQFRRKFFALTNKPGIDNKVVSFIGLVSGKDDLLVMDRIQSRHLWDDGRYEGKNIYDGINKGGLSSILGGPRGLMVTEMLENGLKDSAKKAYEMIGRPQDGSLGRMHWETWLIEGNQGVSHSTLQSVRSGSPIGFGVTEGKPGTFSSGMTYRQAINGPVVEYPLSEGNVVRMTPERQKEFEMFVKAPKNGIVPKGFKVTESVSGPWYERPEVNRRKLDDAARQFENANADGSFRSGDVRPYAGGDTLSERRRKFLRAFRADQGRRAAATGVVQGVDNGRRTQETSGPYQRGTVEGYGGDGLLSFSPDSSALTQYQSAGLNLPVIRQLDAAANAPAYNVEMTNAMANHRLGSQVEIKSAEDLSGYNLFRTEAGSGFAIKPDGDIVAVFASPNEPKGGSFAMLQAAVQAGGTKLDAFDTYLPEIYEAVGFRPVARLPWNDEFAPPNWDKKAFAKYSKGEPDVVFFVHDPEYFGGAKDVPVVTDYDDAVRLQDEALGAVTPAAKGPEAQALSYDAEKIAKLPRVVNDPVAQRFNEQVGADPEAAIAQYRQLPDSKGGKVLNTDFVRELSPNYRNDRGLSQNVHDTSTALNQLMYQRALRDTMGQEGAWVFTGGGAASGKTAGLPDEMIDSYDLVVDGTLANFEKSSAQIDQALDSGKAVTVIYVDRPPEKAFPLLLNRANKMEKELGSGRTVPLDIFLGAHRDARESIKKIENKYKNDERVAIQVVNNHGAEGKQFLTTVDNVSKMDYNTSLPKITQALEDAYEQGKISESIYLATKGSAQPRPEGAQRQAPKNDTARNAGDEPKLEQGNQIVTEQQRQDWREANKGDFRQEQTPELAEAAEKLGRGELSISDYSKEVDRLRPITPLTEVPRISSFEDIASALDANKVAKGIIGLDTEIADGTMVGSRLDIPAYNSYNTWVVSVHEGAGTSGSSLGYGKIAVLDDVKFNSNAKSAFGVATGKKPKASFARMNGKWRNVDPEVAREQAEKFIKDPNWTQVGMNPYRHSFFYDKATGQPVDSAKEVIQIGPLVLARDVKTRPLESPEHALDPKKRKKGEPDYFKHGGSVERVYNDNRTYK